MKSIAVAVLAAGAATRFGSAKQLADIDGKFMLQRVLDCCNSLTALDTYLVLGAMHEEIQPKLNIDSSKIIVNSNWHEGMGSSIAAAALKLQQAYESILFVAGDQPYISAQQLTEMIDRWRESPTTICAAQYGDTIGIPAIFPRNQYSELILLAGDSGAKKLLLDSGQHIQLIKIPQAAMDIDRPEDLSA